MAFVKLDCGILNSTLWVSRGPRDVFLTALLLAVPMELREPMPQFEVCALKKTGFVVPPGWYGFVQAAGPGIVRLSMLEHAEGMAALAKLGEPDEESRSSDFEGRRLVRVDGGFVVLNFMKYRDKDETSAARSKRYRERKAEREARNALPVTDVASRVIVDASRVIRHESSLAEAEAEADIKTVTVVKAVGAEKQKARGSRLPADWQLPDDWRQWAKTERPDLDPDRTADHFRDYWHSRTGSGATKADWQATWRYWVREQRAPPFSRPQGAAPPEPEWRREQRERMQQAAPYAVPRPVNHHQPEAPTDVHPLPPPASATRR